MNTKASFITQKELVQKLLGIKRAQFVSMVTHTNPTMLKTGRVSGKPNPFSKLTRVSFRHVNLGVSYENAVNNRREGEGHPGEFKAEALWKGSGALLDGSKVVARHQTTGELYCAFYPKEGKSKVEDLWLADGNRVTLEEVQEFLPPPPKNFKQELQKPVQWRVISIENIKEITISGDTFKVV